MTAKDLKKPQNIALVKPISNVDSTVNHTTKKKAILEVGSLHEVDESNDENLDEIFHDNKL